MSGRQLDKVGVVPPLLWKHLGAQLDVTAPEVASLRAIYRRRQTLFEHQEAARSMLGFRQIGDGDRRALVRGLREELERIADVERLLQFARRRLYEQRRVVARDRELRAMVAAATRLHEAALARQIHRSVPALLFAEWQTTLLQLHKSGSSVQRWLWAAPGKHSTRQIEEMLSRYDHLRSLGVDRHLSGISDVLLRRYARRLAARPPSIGARIHEPARTIEVACFLRYCLLLTTDQLLLMVRRRVAELWHQAEVGIDPRLSQWGILYRELMGELTAMLADPTLTDWMIRLRVARLVDEHQHRSPSSRAEIVRGRMIDAVQPVRALLRALVSLPWRSIAGHPVTEALATLRRLYQRDERRLPTGIAIPLGRVWKAPLEGANREHAFKAFEVATLLSLRRALRNGTVWVEHSLSFRSRERLFLPEESWRRSRRVHYRRLGLPQDAAEFLEPLVERALDGMGAVARAAAKGELEIDDELHLTRLAAEEQDPRLAKLREALDERIGEAQLPEIILAVDARVRFSWIMLGREPRSSEELLMVYAGILAHGTALSAAETARMIPQLSAASIRQAMRWAGDGGRLAQACTAVLAFMQRHPIAETWGRADLASSDMMSLETSWRVWQARVDPRRRTPSVGVYSHVRARWGISYAQPIVLLERQGGAAIEGVIRDEQIETSQLAVDTHGYTDFTMALAKLLAARGRTPRLRRVDREYWWRARRRDVSPWTIACEQEGSQGAIEAQQQPQKTDGTAL